MASRHWVQLDDQLFHLLMRVFTLLIRIISLLRHSSFCGRINHLHSAQLVHLVGIARFSTKRIRFHVRTIHAQSSWKTDCSLPLWDNIQVPGAVDCHQPNHFEMVQVITHCFPRIVLSIAKRRSNHLQAETIARGLKFQFTKQDVDWSVEWLVQAALLIPDRSWFDCSTRWRPLSALSQSGSLESFCIKDRSAAAAGTTKKSARYFDWNEPLQRPIDCRLATHAPWAASQNDFSHTPNADV